jgi:peptide/nickel transport system substrate-binding protein
MYDNTNSRRQQEFQLIKESAEKAGFKIKDVGDVNWGTRLGRWTYDVALFGWQSEGTGYHGVRCELPHRCSEQLRRLLEQEDRQDPRSRSARGARRRTRRRLSTELEKQLTEDAFGAPIFQFPAAHLQREAQERVYDDRCVADDDVELLGVGSQLIRN